MLGLGFRVRNLGEMKWGWNGTPTRHVDITLHTLPIRNQKRGGTPESETLCSFFSNPISIFQSISMNTASDSPLSSSLYHFHSFSSSSIPIPNSYLHIMRFQALQFNPTPSVKLPFKPLCLWIHSQFLHHGQI